MQYSKNKSIRSIGIRAGVLTVGIAAFLFATDPAAAASDVVQPLQSQEDLKEEMRTVGRFISIVIAAVAIPNGAFGVFQYMTAGTDTEQSEKGRKRIRNSFVGVAGAGVIIIAVQLLTSMLEIGEDENGAGGNSIQAGLSIDVEPLVELQTAIVNPLLDAQVALLQVFQGF